MTTFLFTDVEGSTRLWEAHPDLMPEVIARHDVLVGAIVTSHGGRVVRNRAEGDSSFAVFAASSASVAAALDIHRAMRDEPWPGGLTIRTRAAVHADPDGPPPEATSWYGAAVNRCVRLRAIGHGGQTLVSATAAAECDLPPGATLRGLGVHRLKDLAEAEDVHEVVTDDLPSEHPPLRSIDVVRHNLPELTTSWVGPAGRIEDLAALLASGRLVTLTGTAGVGKTRLALELAHLAVGRQAVWLVTLAERQTGGVEEAVAATIGVKEQPGRSLVDTIRDALQSGEVLLVLDNCEHLLADVARLTARLLPSCPTLRVLATSRQALGVPGEQVRRVASLSAEQAVDLFRQRALLVAGDLGDEEAEAVVAIVEALDGIPLAVEMAAARARTTGVADVLSGLRDRLSLTAGGGGRQATLRAAIEWSHDLLDEPERIMLRRLAVLPTFTLDTAEAVGGADPVDPLDVFDLVARLADKSLVAVDADNLRSRMPHVVRAFGLERLRGSGDEVGTRRRHLAWAKEVAVEADGVFAAGGSARLDRIDAEVDNIRAALAWGGVAGEDHDQRLFVAMKLARYWDARGLWREGRAQIVAALGVPTSLRSYRATALRWSGLFAERTGLYAEAVVDLQAAAAGYEELATSDDGAPYAATFRAEAAGAHYALAELSFRLGDLDSAEKVAMGVLSAASDLGDDRTQVSANLVLAAVATLRGDDARAMAAADAAVSGSASLDDARIRGVARNRMGMVHRYAGRLDEAERWYGLALEEAEATDDEAATAQALHNLADLAVLRRQPEARRLCERAVEIARRLGDVRGDGEALGVLSRALLLEGAAQEAVIAARDAMEQAESLGNSLGAAESSIWLGVALYAVGDRLGAISTIESAVEKLTAGGDIADAAVAQRELSIVRFQ